MAKSKKELIDRRRFMKGAAAGGLGALVASTGAIAAPQGAVAAKAAIPPPELDPTGAVEVLTTDRPGSDFMVDVLKTMNFEFIAANPGSTFRSLHESIINYGGNKAPELITCCHEESAVGIAHGYAEVEGRPMAVMMHATVGTQHGSMGIYNAWAGQAPIFMLIGNTIDATVPHLMFHAAPDVAAMIRDFTKWDDQPVSLQHFAESSIRAYKMAMTLPYEPVAIVVDSELQETPISKSEAVPHIPKLTLTTAPQADQGSINEIARLLVNAENPVILAGKVVRSQASMDNFIAFAEALQAPIVGGDNLPSEHPLAGGGRGAIANADVILALQVDQLWNTLHADNDQLFRRPPTQVNKPTAKIITMNTRDLYARSNFQDLPRVPDVDMAVAADPEITIPALTEAIKKLTTDSRRSAFMARGKKLADASVQARERAHANLVYGWNSSPINWNRISAEVWDQVKSEDWVSFGFPFKAEKYYQRTNIASAAGQGFHAPTAVGAALAHKKHGRLFVYVQPDGSLMYAPGVLWTAAHHRIPMLAVMHNNRAYHQEVMHIERMSARHNRGIDRAGIGTKLEDPNMDYAMIAKGMGLYAEGPITNPNDLGPAIKRALVQVKKGEPALLDVFTQPR